MPLFLGLGGLALGVGKNYLVDKPAAERKRKLAAQTQRYSPWTGMNAQAPSDPDPVAAGLSYGSQGAMLGQNIGNANAQQDLMKSQSDWLKKRNYWGGMY